MRSVILLLLLSYCTASAQDTSSLAKLFSKLDFDISGSGYFQPASYKRPKAILLPDQIRASRQNHNPAFNQGWKEASDNPVFHGTYFLAFNTRYRFNKHITLHASLLTEHRGLSYGTTNMDNITVFPQVKLDIKKSIRLFTDSLHMQASLGNRMDPRLYEGLTIYNMYQQGVDASVRWKKFGMRFSKIADLFNSFGLRINDADDYIALFETGINHAWAMNIQAGYSDYRLYDIAHRGLFNFSTAFYRSEQLRFYLQASYRPSRGAGFNTEEVLGGVAGVKWKKTGKLRLESVLEGRFYGKGFNEGFYGPEVIYRDPAKPIYANTVGKYLYPLLLFDRSFSQWAVFTEYQGKNVAAATCQLGSTYFFYKDLGWKTDLDFNCMFASSEDPFLYPFYNTGLAWQKENNLLMISVTNKGMNLDVHYPTFYMYRDPVVMLTLKRTLDEKWFD